MYVGAADEIGMSGCQIWFHIDLRLQPREVRHVYHRLTVVVGFLQSKAVGVIAMCGHAPTEAATPADKDRFWECYASTFAEFTSRYPDYIVVELLDANARVAQHGN